MIQENFHILTLADDNVEAIVVIGQCIVDSALDDDRLIWIQLPAIQGFAGGFDELHFGQIEQTEFSCIVDDHAENVWNEGLIKDWEGFIFLEFERQVK
jgi:hypothetical protein